MNVIFAQNVDSCAYAGPDAPGTATFGTMQVGLSGLLQLLRGQLGLGGGDAAHWERAVSLMGPLLERPGSFHLSAQRNPWVVANDLLRLADQLKLEGWNGVVRDGRLGELSDLVTETPDGIAEQLREVIQELGEIDKIDIETLTLVDPRAAHPARVRALLNRLEDLGVLVEPMVYGPSSPVDVQLVRPDHATAAAEVTASWIANQDPDSILIIGVDEVLDRALRRHGVGTTAALPEQCDSLLQVLPLTLELLWTPPEPTAVQDLLNLPASPIPGICARHLRWALNEWPAVGSSTWNDAFETGLAKIDPHREPAVRARLEAILTPVADHEVQTDEVLKRIDVLRRWLGGRKAVVEDSAWDAALLQTRILREMLVATSRPAQTRPQLTLLVRAATSCVSGSAPWAATAGIQSVVDPAAVLGPAETIVWWNFLRDTAPRIRRSPLTPVEQEALAAAGIHLPDSVAQAAANALRWRRPAERAAKLVLVCPHTSDGALPHPFWDELKAADTEIPVLARPSSSPEASWLPEALATPVPKSSFLIKPHLVRQRDRESPTSMTLGLGCPLAYLFEYTAKVREGAASQLASGNQLKGSLAHELLAEILTIDPLPSAADCADRMGLLFDAQGPTFAAEYFQYGRSVECETLRWQLCQAAKNFVLWLEDNDATVVRAEEPKHANGLVSDGTRMQGRPDVIAMVGDERFVIDFKFSGRWHATTLKSGLAIQIAVYAWLEADGGSAVDAGYFVLLSGKLVTTSSRVKRSQQVDGWGTDETFRALNRQWKLVREEMDRGEIRAAWTDEEEPPKAGMNEDGDLLVRGNCGWCKHRRACGVATAERGVG